MDNHRDVTWGGMSLGAVLLLVSELCPVPPYTTETKYKGPFANAASTVSWEMLAVG